MKTYDAKVAGTFNQIQVRVTENGNNTRYVLAPGDDLSGQPKVVTDLAAEHWTQTIINDYQAQIAPEILSPEETRARFQRRVKAEADRRITALVGADTSRQKDIRISNATREAVKLLRVGEANWTAEQAARAAVLEGLDAAIDAIRDKSNALEPMDPIPADFTDNSYWI